MYNDDIVFDDVECDGCGQVLGACTEDEWEELRKDYVLCFRCTPSCCSSDTHRRVGNIILAAQVERQWVIDRSLWRGQEVLTTDDIPF